MSDLVPVGPAKLPRRRVPASATMMVPATIRVQRAKRLLDKTDLAMTAIALQAGFHSLRRFNAAFAETYRKRPSDIRRRQTKPRKIESDKLSTCCILLRSSPETQPPSVSRADDSTK